MSKQVIKHELARKIEGLLACEGPLRRDDIVKKLGCKRTSAYNALLVLLLEGKVGKRAIYQLKKGRPAVVYILVGRESKTGGKGK